ncbi:MAG: ferredoxin [Pseudomonadota bacterium]
MTFEEVRARAAQEGLTVTGWLHPELEHGAPEGTETLLLLGYGGPELWAAFQASVEAHDGAPHGLDRWSARVIGAMAAEVGGEALFPFGGPPYQPFIRWTYAAEPVHQSRLGMSIHETYGLWSGWRGALALTERLDPPPMAKGDHPCEPCPAPCRAACPAGAFSDEGYDVAGCRAHLNSEAGAPCRAAGCLARRACPVGAEFAHAADQGAFHLEAFRVA